MNQFILNTKKSLRLSVLTLSLLTGSLLSRAAGDDSVANHNGRASTAEVKYIGSHEGEALFNVLYNNSTGSRFSVKVVDNEGNQLFEGTYTDKKFDKKFKIIDAGSYGKLTFVIRSFQDNSIQHFEINSNTRLVEDVEVKEVK